MSKRTEDLSNQYIGHPFEPDEDAAITMARGAYRQGYEQAEKDTIRTVKTWLSEIHRVCDITDENGYHVELRNLVASLEKTMEEE